MPDVRLNIGGRHYDVHCQAGDEAHLQRLAQQVDAKAKDAHAAIGGINETRQLVFAALMLADDSLQAAGGSKSLSSSEKATNDSAIAAGAIDRLAERIEALAMSLSRA